MSSSSFLDRVQPLGPHELRGSDFNRWLIARGGAPSPRVIAEQWLPIPHPEFRDLPPTVQFALAAEQMRQERMRMAAAQ